MDAEENDRETENTQWNYLDGTPARLNEDVGRGTGLLEQTVADVVHMLNPFSWFRKKPTRTNSQIMGQSRRPMNADRNQNVPSRRPVNNNVASNQDERPAKRHRPGFSSGADYGNAGLPRDTSNQMDEEMPPNVEFTSDERPSQPSTSKNYNDMMTDDEDDEEPSRPSTSNNHKSIFNSNRPNQANKFFSPLGQKSDVNARRSMPVQSSERKSTLLPLIESHNLNRSNLRNPLTEQSKISPMMAPTPSRKRGFDAVDRDDGGEVPKLFSMFPKTSERTTVPSRFGSPAKFGEGNKKTAPLYAMKRLETLKNGDFTNRDRMSLSPFKALPSLQKNNNTNTIDSPNRLSTSRKAAPVKLDYSYVIQSPSPASSRGQFHFVSAVVVPNGELAKAVKAVTRDDRESSVTSGSSEMNTSARLCNKCGISVKLDGGNKCEVCERLKSPGKKVNEEDDEPMEVRKASTSTAKENTTQKEGWSCDLCGESNREDGPCKSCGKSRKFTKSIASESPKQDSSPKRARPSSPVPADKSKESENTAPSAKSKENSTTSQSASMIKPPSISTAGTSAPVNDLWSKLTQAKTWTCSTCWSSNGDQLSECAACQTAKPGTEKKTTTTAAAAKPAFSFGGPQAAPPAVPASTIPPAIGFSFGGAQPASNAIKPAAEAPVASSTGFSFGNLTTPKATAALTGSTSGGFSGFSGFGNLPGVASTSKSGSDSTTTAAAAVTTAPSAATDKPAATFAFGVPPASAATTSAGLPSLTGFGLPSFSTSGSGIGAAPSIFAGFASGSSAASAQPSEPSSTSGLQSKGFGFGLPAPAATTGDNAAKPAAAGGLNFQFGAAPSSGTSAFVGFGSLNASGTTPLFGQQNGLAPQTNGLPQGSAAAAPSFTFSSGIPTFGAATAGLQNGSAASQIPAPGFMGAPAGAAPVPNGTFGSAAATIGGSVGPQRRVLVPKRRLNPR